MPLHSSPELERPPELPGALAAQALRASESRYRRLFEAARDGILLLNSKTAQIEDVNPYLIEMLGYSHAEFLGKKLWEVGSFADVAECKEMFAGLQSTGYVEYSDLPLKTKAGARIAVEFVSNAYDCEGVRVIQCNIRNITARNEAYAHIRRQTQLFAALSQCNKAIARCASVDEMLPLICRHAVELGGMTMAWIGFADAATLEVRPAASFGDDTGYLRDIAVTIAAESPFAGGPTGTALREDRPYWCQDFQNDPATLPWRERGRRAGWGASAALPLHRNGVVVGVFALYCATTQCFDESARDLLVEMAADISFALDNFAREAQRKQAEAALVESTQLLETIVDTVPMRVFWKDRDLRYLGCNTALAKDAGFREPGDVIGKDDFQMGWASQAEAYRSDDRKVMASGIPRLSYDEVQTTPEGRQMWLRTSKVPIRGRGNETIGVLGTYEDITEHKLSELALRAADERFRGLVEQVIAGIFIIQDGKFVYANPRLAEILAQGSPDELIGTDAMSWIGEVDRSRATEDIRRLVDGEAQSVAAAYAVRRRGGSMIEIDTNSARATYEGRPAIIGLLQDISERKLAEEQQRGFVEELKTAFMSTVEVATIISEMRDPYTAGHERRVADIAVAIGTELALEPRRLEGLRVAGSLHDIGKITVPAEILTKPRKLTAIEYQIIQGHAQAGYDVLKGVAFPWPVALVALQHHERVDGSGYPQGLKGEAILLEARIMAVADVVEAMSSHRPYRPGLGIAAGLAEIERGRGTAYDAGVADACLRLFREKGYALPATA